MSSRKTLKCRRCPSMIYPESITRLCADCLRKDRAAQRPDQLLATDRTISGLRDDLATTKKKLLASEADVRNLEKQLNLFNEVTGTEINPTIIEPKHPSGTAEGTVVLVASDWHLEERVDPTVVSYLNQYNLDIAEERVKKFFRSSQRLIKLLQQDIKVEEVVLALLGDTISNDIHDEFPEICQLTPMHAIEFAQNLIVGGIQFLLENTKVKLTIPCHSGNHGRTTKTTHFAEENGHSLEYLMYRHIENHFRGEERVKLLVSPGYHSYMDVYGTKIRFHHGHAINYQGGIGGIFIPAFKAISQWDKARQADLDIFGHFHQHKDGGKFVSNGSLIGFNSFALRIKADYEQPKQTLLLIDKERGRTCTWPILFTK